MGQGDSARDFDPSESMENAGILCVFPIFHTARLGEKICRSPQYPLCGVAIKKATRFTNQGESGCTGFVENTTTCYESGPGKICESPRPNTLTNMVIIPCFFRELYKNPPGGSIPGRPGPPYPRWRTHGHSRADRHSGSGNGSSDGRRSDDIC